LGSARHRVQLESRRDTLNAIWLGALDRVANAAGVVAMVFAETAESQNHRKERSWILGSQRGSLS
jgi:hypothetical protein